MTTLAPSRASATALARPMPREAPVTIATFPASSIICSRRAKPNAPAWGLVHVPLLRQQKRKAGTFVDFDLHQGAHRLAPARIDGVLGERGDRLFKIVRLEITKERKAVAEDRIVANARLLQRVEHLRPDFVMALLVFLLAARLHFEHPGVLAHLSYPPLDAR